MLPQGDTTGPKSRALVFAERDIADPQMSNEATDGLAPSVFAIFRAQLERIHALFRQRAKKHPRRETTVLDSRRAPVAWCSRTGTLRAQISTGRLTLISNTPQTKRSYSGSPHPIFHRGPLCHLPCTKCHILARSIAWWLKKTRRFQDHRAVALIMSSPSPSTRKRIGRGVCNFDSGVGDREKQNAVLSGSYAKFTQNPATKNHFLCLTKRFWMNPALWTQCGALVSGRMVSGPTTNSGGEEKLAR